MSSGQGWRGCQPTSLEGRRSTATRLASAFALRLVSPFPSDLRSRERGGGARELRSKGNGDTSRRAKAGWVPAGSLLTSYLPGWLAWATFNLRYRPPTQLVVNEMKWMNEMKQILGLWFLPGEGRLWWFLKYEKVVVIERGKLPNV